MKGLVDFVFGLLKHFFSFCGFASSQGNRVDHPASPAMGQAQELNLGFGYR